MDDEDSDLNAADELLSHRSLPVRDDSGRAQLRAKTLVMVGNQRRRSFAGWAAIVVVAYLAGWGTQSFFRLSLQNQAVTKAEQKNPAVSPISSKELDHVIEPSELISRKLKHVGETSTYESLRRAGDYQLVERNDLTAALRLYHRALKTATPAELQQVDEKSTWLWNELKHDRNRQKTQEKSNADRTL